MRGGIRLGLSWLCAIGCALGCAERGVGVESRGSFIAGIAPGAAGRASLPEPSPELRGAPVDTRGRYDLNVTPLGPPSHEPGMPPPAQVEQPGERTDVTCVNRAGFEPGVTVREPIGSRFAHVTVPASYDGTTALPVVIDFHGLGGSAVLHRGSQAEISGWREKGAVEQFISVFPEGLDASWNGGALCCPPSNIAKVDDVGFAREIVKHLSSKACIDTSRVYATGIGNGGALAHLLACQAADVFAATAPVSMGNGTSMRDCRPARPISVVMFRGTEDATVNYHGGIFPSALEDLEQWRAINGCSGDPFQSHEGRCQTYSQCREGVRVTLCSPRAGNVLYADAAQQGIAVPDIAWDIFRTQHLF